MVINDVIGPYIGVFIEWGFLMAFLYNLVSRLNNPDKAIVQVAFIMASSYLLSDLYKFTHSNYLNWLIYDILTVLVLVMWHYHIIKKDISIIYYLYIGLAFNSILMIAIHTDIYILDNKEQWWLWSVYSLGVNLSDSMMIIALVFNKDFLGFAKCYKWILKNKTLSQSRCI